MENKKMFDLTLDGDVYEVIRDTVKYNCNLDCEKCGNLKANVRKLEEENDELAGRLNYYMAEHCNLDTEEELEELREMCDEKSKMIDELHIKNKDLEERNAELLKAFIKMAKVVDAVLDVKDLMLEIKKEVK